MMTRLFLLLCLFVSIGLSAQEARYQISTTFGLAGLNGNALEVGAFSGASIDRIAPLGPKTNLFFGLGLQHSNYEAGAAEQPCDFPLGDKVVSFTFSETYAFNPLEGALRFGVQQRLGKFSISGMVLPTFRLYDRITSTSVINFFQPGRPTNLLATKVRPREQFTWTDGTTREVRYNSPFHLRAGLEVDFALTKQLAIGAGYQAGLSKYELTNYLQDSRPGDETTEFAVTTEDARTAQGYLLIRLRL